MSSLLQLIKAEPLLIKTFLYSYLILINLIALFMYGYDKHQAKVNRWRIREFNLILVALLGGSLGSYIAMKAFRHKTNKTKFKLTVPFLLLIHLLLCIYFIIRI